MVRLADIAKKLNLSEATVSLALSGHGRVATKTRKRVLRCAEELGYVKSGIAKSLATGVTHNIGFIYNWTVRSRPFFLDEVYARVFDGIDQEAKQHGYHIFVRSITKGDEGSVLFDNKVDGVIYAGDISDRIINLMRTNKTPFVMAGNARINAIDVDCVVPDSSGAAYLATEYLIKLGHRQLGLISVPKVSYTSVAYDEGFRRALQVYSVPLKDVCIEISQNIESGRESMFDMMRKRKRPTGVICYSDQIALGAIEATKELELVIPDDVSVVGTNDTTLTKLATPRLTSVRFDTAEIGRRAFSLLLEKIKSGDSEPMKVVLKPTLVQRVSCASPIPK